MSSRRAGIWGFVRLCAPSRESGGGRTKRTELERTTGGADADQRRADGAFGLGAAHRDGHGSGLGAQHQISEMTGYLSYFWRDLGEVGHTCLGSTRRVPHPNVFGKRGSTSRVIKAPS